MVKKSITVDSRSVDEYIVSCPKNVQGKLKELRNAIREVAPNASETTSYFQMPGYFYKGYDYNGMFAWFGLQRSHIGLYLRPPTVENHKKELSGYATTKAVVHFPVDKKIPLPLVKKLVRASLKIMKDKSK